MLHFSKISSKGKDFNLIASGALAFKIHNKILKDESFVQGTKISRNMLLNSSITRPANAGQKKIFFVIISDLDKTNVAALCHTIAEERAKGGYAVCQVIPMYHNEPSFKVLRLLRQNFDEVMELNKFSLDGSKTLSYAGQHQCLVTDYSLAMARIMYHMCVNDFTSNQSKTEQRLATPAYA